jgi:hypothetical protein
MDSLVLCFCKSILQEKEHVHLTDGDNHSAMRVLTLPSHVSLMNDHVLLWISSVLFVALNSQFTTSLVLLAHCRTIPISASQFFLFRYGIIALLIYTMEWTLKGGNYSDVLIRFMNCFSIADFPLTYLIWGQFAMQFQALVFDKATKQKYFFILGLMFFSWTSYSYGVLYSVAYLMKDIPIQWKGYPQSILLIGLGVAISIISPVTSALNSVLGIFQIYPSQFKGGDIIAACLMGVGFELIPYEMNSPFLKFFTSVWIV